MKTILWITTLSLTLFYSCNMEVKPGVHKTTFGIYETVSSGEILDSILSALKSADIQVEAHPKPPIIGYIKANDSASFWSGLSVENFKLIKAAYPVNNDTDYVALVAVKPNPVISISDIQKSRNKERDVEIFFNLDGSRKWADLTKRSTGNIVAFVIGDKVYGTPVINAEIKSGIAVIKNLKDEETAKAISQSINYSIQKHKNDYPTLQIKYWLLARYLIQ